MYDATGQLAAEYTNSAPPPVAFQYLATDHLGSTRLTLDAATGDVKRYDYYPFGQEISANLRTANGGQYSSPVCPSVATPLLRDKFSGKERDAETDLDYFLARYYNSAQGRFTWPDEFPGGLVDPFTGQQVGQPGPLPYADITDRQTLNKYAYVRNNPLRYVDPDGHADIDPEQLLVNTLTTKLRATVLKIEEPTFRRPTLKRTSPSLDGRKRSAKMVR